MQRGAPLAVLDDKTPLNGERVDVGIRLGWMLRMARLTGEDPAGTLDEMLTRLRAAGVVTSAATLHRVETGLLRDGSIVDAYERALRVTPGSLRAPTDIISRTYPYGPDDRRPGIEVTTVAQVDEALSRVQQDHPRGSDWLSWARVLSEPNVLGLPTSIAAPLVARLTSEMGRSVGQGYICRYEALSLLRRSAYGGIVLRVAQQVVETPHVQVLNDLLSAVGEADTPDASAWCLDLLLDPRDRVVGAASIGLENMAAVGGRPDFWDPLVPTLVARYNETVTGSNRWRWLSHLMRLMPRRLWAAVSAQLAHQPSPEAQTRSWSRTRENAHWAMCASMAAQITETLGLPEQPLLARLLFEIAVGGHETRAVTAYMLLGALPAVQAPAATLIAEVAQQHPDPVVRERAGRRLGGMLSGVLPASTRDWWAEPGELRAPGLLLVGTAGLQLEEAALRAILLEDPGVRREAMYAAGMSAHPLLDSLTQDPAFPAEARGAAAWWLSEGARVPH